MILSLVGSLIRIGLTLYIEGLGLVKKFGRTVYSYDVPSIVVTPALFSEI